MTGKAPQAFITFAYSTKPAPNSSAKLTGSKDDSPWPPEAPSSYRRRSASPKITTAVAAKANHWIA
jgi:hypothetical protein